MPLGERNSAQQVADYWGVSKRTVNRRIAEGALACLRFGSVVRITREQVAEYEARCTQNSGGAPMASIPAPLGNPSKGVFQRGQEIAFELKYGSPHSSSPKMPRAKRPPSPGD